MSVWFGSESMIQLDPVAARPGLRFGFGFGGGRRRLRGGAFGNRGDRLRILAPGLFRLDHIDFGRRSQSINRDIVHGGLLGASAVRITKA
jgi:hypothetical protein